MLQLSCPTPSAQTHLAVWQPTGPGDYNNPIQRGEAYERPTSAEIFNMNGVDPVQVNCGIRVHGSAYHRPRYNRGDDWTAD